MLVPGRLRPTLRSIFALLFTTTALVSLAGCAKTHTLRVMTYNIHHGRGTDGVIDLERIANVISEHRPDMVALQEVDRCTRRSGGRDVAFRLGKLTGMYALFGTAMPYDGGEYGEALLTRWKPDTVETWPLRADPEREPRAALVAEFIAGAGSAARKPGGETEGQVTPPFSFTVIATHLDHLRDPSSRIMQMEDIIAAAKDIDGPAILMGDLNGEPDMAEIQMLSPDWRDAAAANPQPTFPSDEPDIRIDYVFVRPPGQWRMLRTQVVEETIASDHRPLLAILEMVN